MNNPFALCVAVLAALIGLPGGPAWAHHSFAMFDHDKIVTLQGTVKEFQWSNPHSWIQLMVKNSGGASEEWSIEGGSPNSLARQGWKASSLKTGDEITLTTHPLKNGSKGGSLMSVTLASGQVLGQSETSAAAPIDDEPATGDAK